MRAVPGVLHAGVGLHEAGPEAVEPGAMIQVFVLVESTLNCSGQEDADACDPVPIVDWLAPNPVELFVRLFIMVLGDVARVGEPLVGTQPEGMAEVTSVINNRLAALSPESAA